MLGVRSHSLEYALTNFIPLTPLKDYLEREEAAAIAWEKGAPERRKKDALERRKSAMVDIATTSNIKPISDEYLRFFTSIETSIQTFMNSEQSEKDIDSLLSFFGISIPKQTVEEKVKRLNAIIEHHYSTSSESFTFVTITHSPSSSDEVLLQSTQLDIDQNIISLLQIPFKSNEFGSPVGVFYPSLKNQQIQLDDTIKSLISQFTQSLISSKFIIAPVAADVVRHFTSASRRIHELRETEQVILALPFVEMHTDAVSVFDSSTSFHFEENEFWCSTKYRFNYSLNNIARIDAMQDMFFKVIQSPRTLLRRELKSLTQAVTYLKEAHSYKAPDDFTLDILMLQEVVLLQTINHLNDRKKNYY